MDVRFASRQAAGRELGQHLQNRGLEVDLVAGLPRGGVVVAAEVAHMLQRPLDVLVVRKIGHPQHREFAVGALAEGDVTLLDENIAGEGRLHEALVSVIAEEKQRLQTYQEKFHRFRKTGFAGKAVLLVDDGLATGATARAAVRSVREQGARKVFLAVPVAATDALDRLAALVDGAAALVVDPGFDAVGRYYRDFSATTDEEVLALLRRPDESAG